MEEEEPSICYQSAKLLVQHQKQSEKPFATEAGYYMTGRADSGMQPPLLGNQADSLSAFQQELLLSLPGFARYGGNRLESKGKFFSQTAPASGG